MAIPEWLKLHGISHPRQRKFLQAYCALGMISKAAAKAEIDRELHYYWLKTNEKYREAFAEAYERAGDLLEDEAFRRAVDGVAKPVFYEGQECGAIQEYSDGLMALQIKGRKPKFREKSTTELTGKDGGAVIIKVLTGVPDPEPKSLEADGTNH